MTTTTAAPTAAAAAAAIVDAARRHADRAEAASAAAYELGEDDDELVPYVNAAYHAAIAAEDAVIDALAVARDIIDWRRTHAFRQMPHDEPALHYNHLRALVLTAAEHADDAEAALADAVRMVTGAAAR